MSNTLNLGTDGNWAVKKGSLLAYNSENGNFKPLPFDFTRASSATVVNKDGLIEIVGSGEPRIDFKDDSNGALLLEPTRSNLITYSEDFSNGSWSKSAAGTGTIPILTSNYGISPDGLQNASRMQMNLNGGVSGGDISYLTRFLTSIAPATNSVYLKSLGSDATMTFRCGSTFKSILVTSGWQRFDVTDASGTDRLQLLLYGNSDSQSADLLIYGAQLEQGSYATSYIPTQGAISTKVAEVCNGAGNSQIFNDSEGVLFAEISALDKNTTKKITLNNGSNSQVLVLEYTSTVNQIRVFLSNGSLQFNEYVTLSDVTNNNKIAIKYKENDFALWVNGIEVASDLIGTTFAEGTLTNLSFDDGSGFADFYGNTKQIKYFNTALTDAELQALTS